jgi:hypothetical protein
MAKVLKILTGLVVVLVVVYAGYRYFQSRRALKAGLLTENITHDGDLWKANFTARVPAPEQTVFDAIRNIENTHSDQVKAVRVVSQSTNKKIVDLDIATFGGQTITTELEFEYLPADKKIVYHTLNNPLLDTHAAYQLGDEGSSTLIDYHETTHLLQSFPVPDGVIKQVIRTVFISQLETLNRSLNVKTADSSGTSDDEP